MKPTLHVVPKPLSHQAEIDELRERLADPPTAIERARADEMAAQAECLAYCAEAVERLRDIGRLHFATVSVAHDAPIAADRLSADIARMLASLKNGRIR